MSESWPIVVAGAGSVGGYVGGMLAFAGHRVSLLARPRVIAEIEHEGILLTDVEGLQRHVAPPRLSLSNDPAILRGAGVVLVTVKSADTPDVADLIACHAPPDAVIVSLQNGVGNAAVL